MWSWGRLVARAKKVVRRKTLHCALRWERKPACLWAHVNDLLYQWHRKGKTCNSKQSTSVDKMGRTDSVHAQKGGYMGAEICRWQTWWELWKSSTGCFNLLVKEQRDRQWRVRVTEVLEEHLQRKTDSKRVEEGYVGVIRHMWHAVRREVAMQLEVGNHDRKVRPVRMVTDFFSRHWLHRYRQKVELW